MSTTYNEYRNKCIDLANSVFLKVHDIAKYIEFTITNTPSTDLRQWKYYLNLSGNYHSTNELMYVTSLDTLEEIAFTKENLEIHKSTKKGYIQEAKYLKELNARYPENGMLIKCILDPIDLETAIKSPDYTIININSSFIEAQEVSLPNRLQDKINNAISLWYNNEFKLVDEFYFLEFYKSMITWLPNFIEQIREENEFTHEVHSYYLWGYLESKAGLLKYKDYLTFDQAHWFYRNINYVLKNLGKQKTLADLIDVLLTRKDIAIGRYTLDHDTEELENNLSLTPSPIAVKHPMNLTELVGNDKIIRTIGYVLKNQIPLARGNGEAIEDVIEHTIDKLTSHFQVPMKVLELSAFKDTKNSIFDIEDVLIYSWAYYSYVDIYKSRFFIRNAKTGSMMNMNAKETFMVYMYLLAKKENMELTDFFTFPVYNVLEPNWDKEVDFSYIENEVDHRLLDYYKDNYPVITDIISPETFKENCESSHRFLNIVNRLINMGQDQVENSRLKMMFERTTVNGQIYFNVDGFPDLETWILQNNWDLDELTIADIDLTLENILDNVLSKTEGLIDNSLIQTKLSELLNELTSFNIQILNSSSLSKIKSTQTILPTCGSFQKILNKTIFSDIWEDDHRVSKKVSKLVSVNEISMTTDISKKITTKRKTVLGLNVSNVSQRKRSSFFNLSIGM